MYFMSRHIEELGTFDKIVQFSQAEPQTFWIIVAIIVVILFLMFKPRKNGESPIGLSPFQLEIFKRR